MIEVLTFKLRIWYAASDEEHPQEHVGLLPEQAYSGIGAFMRDMEHLKGRGVRKITVEAENNDTDDDSQ